LAQKNLALNLPRRERVSLVDWDDRELPLVTQAELLSLNRSSLYYQPVPPSLQELHIKRRIDEIYTAWPFYGSRKIMVELNKEMTINRKAVQHHMREMGLSAICPGPNLSKRRQDHVIFPYLLRNVTAAYPNHVWGIEIV
jgi:putative transposase